MEIDALIQSARAAGASDLHLTHDQPPALRRLGQIEYGQPLPAGYAEQMVDGLLNDAQRQRLAAGQDIDFCHVTPDGLRQRVNIFRQQGHAAASIRMLSDHIPTLEELRLPPVCRSFAEKPRGLVLVTGPTGSGKSTTLAAMMQYINQSRRAHIITIEDPVEYRYTPDHCIIHQREVGGDTASFSAALRSALREDPDVILVGEMRDYETIAAALTAAETGHLVFSTLHTIGAASTMERIVNACPGEIQQEIRIQLAGVLQGCITQELLPLADGSGRMAALEVLVATDGVRSLLRENKSHQLTSMMQTGAREGMQTLNAHLAALCRAGLIAPETALERASDPAELQNLLGLRYQ